MEKSISISLAFGAGLLSFFSPCILPLVPAYVSFVTGISFEELTSPERRRSHLRKIILAVFFFILGFSTIFVLLGASASLAGQLLRTYRHQFAKLAGIIIIFFGLHLTGLLKVKALYREKRLSSRKPLNLIGSYFFGMTFAAGWTPCVGPILSAILVYASTSQSLYKGMSLLFIYSLGIGLPFLLLGLIFDQFLLFISKARKYLNLTTKLSGFILIFFGFLLLSNSLSLLSSKLLSLFS